MTSLIVFPPIGSALPANVHQRLKNKRHRKGSEVATSKPWLV
jgi:hypothetical protein